MIYPSKHDLWLGIVILGVMGISTSFVFVSEGLSLAMLVLLVVDVFVLWIWFGTYYLIFDNVLTIHCGPMRKKINIRDIQYVKSSRNPISAPACSMDRIEIKGKKIAVLISPEDKKGFVSSLRDINHLIDIKL